MRKNLIKKKVDRSKKFIGIHQSDDRAFKTCIQNLLLSFIAAQSYEILLQCVSGLPPDEQYLKVTL